MHIEVQFFNGARGNLGKNWKRAAHDCYPRSSWRESTASRRLNTLIRMINRAASAIRSEHWRVDTFDIQRLD